MDAFIALTVFGKEKLLQAGFPAEKVFVKPNVIDLDPGYSGDKSDYALFVGRLSAEKGIKTLMAAWRSLKDIHLKVIGDGPLKEELRQYARENQLETVEFPGRLPHEKAIQYMQNARVLIFPSECYETFGLIAAEAYACGTPVIASRLGAMAEIVREGKTGLLFAPGHAEDLAAKVNWAWEHPQAIKKMGKNARREYEEKYSAERNYEMLLVIYEKAIKVKSKK